MAKPDLPKTVYIARQYSNRATGGRDTWLSAETDVTKLAELGESIQVGRYQLIETAALNGVPLLGKPKAAK